MQFDIEKELGMTVHLHPKFEQIPDDACLNPIHVSEMLNISPETVRRWCRQKKLKAIGFGGKYIIVASDLKEFLRKGINQNQALLH